MALIEIVDLPNLKMVIFRFFHRFFFFKCSFTISVVRSSSPWFTTDSVIRHRGFPFPATTSLPGVIEKKAKGLSCDRKSRDIDESLLGDICIIHNVGDIYDHLQLGHL
jgi:hypothetical protein